MIKKEKTKRTSIGGQALIEGIMMRGPKTTAMAIRNERGEIVQEIWETNAKPVPKFFKIPLIRGIYGFISSMKVGYKCLMRSAEIAMPDLDENGGEETITDSVQEGNTIETETIPNTEENALEVPKAKEKKSSSALLGSAMAIGTVLGIILSLVLFLWLPTMLYEGKIALGNWFSIDAFGGWSLQNIIEEHITNDYGRLVIKSAFEGILRILIFLAYISLVSLMKDIKRTFMYHGAEHKTIFCYENKLPLTIENVKMQRRFHPRCGTSLLIIMMLVGIIIGMFLPYDIQGILRTLIKLAILPITMGLGYEIIRFAGKHDNFIVRILSAPGLWMQRLTTKEPDESMIECAIVALQNVIPEDGSDMR